MSVHTNRVIPGSKVFLCRSRNICGERYAQHSCAASCLAVSNARDVTDASGRWGRLAKPAKS